MPNLACGAGASLTVISELTGDASLFAAIARHFFFFLFLACAKISWCGRGTGTRGACGDPLCGSWAQET